MENMEADKKIIFYNNSYITKYCSWMSSIPVSYSGGSRFKSRSRNRLPQLKFFMTFLRPSRENAGIAVPQLRPLPFPSISFPIYCSWIILLDAIQPELLEASLNKL
jgi:hypothetical protein